MRVRDLTFYLDMDNSMVIFSTRENEEEQLAKMHDKGFFLKLEPAFGLELVLSTLRELGATVKVLSGLIDSPYVYEEKKEWCHRYKFKEEDIILLPMAHRKCDYVPDMNKFTILVDDYFRYVNEWREAGGTSILVDRRHESFATMDRVGKFCDILIALSKWDALDLEDRKLLEERWISLFKNN